MNKVNQIGNLIEDSNYSNPHRGRVYSPEGISPTLNCNGGGSERNKGVGRYRMEENILYNRGKLLIVYDDYNSRIRKDQNTIGTVTPNCGADAIRNGYKLIEVTINERT